MRTIRPVVALVLVLLGGTACDDGTSPRADIAGEYEATTFIGLQETSEIDVLALGGYITMDLLADGTTTGTIFVPGGDEDGSDYTADLTGTWNVDDDQVTFEHGADSFLRDVVFVYDDGRLESSSAYAEVVLTRQ